MKIRTRFLLGGGLAAATTLALVVVLFFTFGRITEAVNTHRVGDEVAEGTFDLNLLLSEYLQYHEERARTQWHLRHKSLGRVLSTAEFKGPRERGLLRVIREEHENVAGLFARLVAAYEEPGAGREEGAVSVQLQERLVGQLAMKSQRMVSSAGRLDEIELLKIEAARDRAALCVVVLAVGTVVVLGVTAILMGSSVVRPVRELQKGTEIVGTGDLDYRVGTSANDEIGQLGRAFDQMTERLKAVTVSRDELGKEVGERRRAEGALERRTREVETVNKELEAFAYSVSHDLRAPLRSMDGFSQVLLEDYADELDEQGKDHLQRVRAASQKMGQLIDDLLRLSRVTRAEMRRETVDLSDLAQETVRALRQGEPERQVECVVQDGVTANGDPDLLRIVLENLLGNAWKFTGKGPGAKIEFGSAEHEGEAVYFVRDDGVGFDMAYVDKLFGAFQRLHSTADFAGTGIGLATVQRIVRRHGGQVWAEGAVEKGATFYFTL